MRPGAGKGQHQKSFFYSVNEQPVRLNVTLSVSFPLSGQEMIPILFRECSLDAN